MARRLSMMSERRLSVMLERMERDLEELKLEQFLDRKAYEIVESQTVSTYDIDITVAALGIYNYKITFTADTDNDSYAQIMSEITAPSEDPARQRALYIKDENLESKNVTVWKFEYVNDNFVTWNLKVKFKVYSIDSGTLTVTAL